ncbi:MAG: hypothetical protein ACRCWQ_10220 [Bacilli bacterium]
MNYMTITALKKELKGLSEKELMELIVTLYKSRKDVKDDLNYRFAGDPFKAELLALYEDRMEEAFFPRTRNGSYSLSTATGLLKEFNKLVDSWDLKLEYQLCFLTCGTEFTCTYGDIDERFYTTMARVFQSFVENLNNHADEELYNKLKKKIHYTIEKSLSIGWGYGDFISDLQYEIIWADA